MTTILIKTEALKECVYRMLRDIEDGKYDHIKYGVSVGMLSCAKTAAMDDFLKKVLEVEE